MVLEPGLGELVALELELVAEEAEEAGAEEEAG